MHRGRGKARNGFLGGKSAVRPQGKRKPLRKSMRKKGGLLYALPQGKEGNISGNSQREEKLGEKRKTQR